MNKDKNKVQIGRVTKTYNEFGYCEFTNGVRKGDTIYYLIDGKPVLCKVTSVKSTPYEGTKGRFRMLDPTGPSARLYTELYIQQDNSGILYLGDSARGRKIYINVNPLFEHLWFVGTTGRGKTHAMIVLAEELMKHKVPLLIFDTAREFVNLKDAYVITDIASPEDIYKKLKKRETVVYNLKGRPNPTKQTILANVLKHIYDEKEKEVSIPMIAMVDDAEIYAPELYLSSTDIASQSKDAMVQIAKYGRKYGFGLIVSSQRPPQLNVDVRSQMNSMIAFHIQDTGSFKVISQAAYIGRFEKAEIQNLPQEWCLLTGQIVTQPTKIHTRDINTQRTKNLDFETILGIRKPESTTPKPKISKLDLSIVDPDNIQFQNPLMASLDETKNRNATHFGRPGKLGINKKQEQELYKFIRKRKNP